MAKLFFVALCCAALTSCSSSSSTPSSTSDGVLTGVFLDSAVEGVAYETESRTGTTNSDGEFKYLSGEFVTFSIGTLNFPTIPAQETITPISMSPSNSIEDNITINIAVLLQSLDDDGIAENGINIPVEAISSAVPIDFTVAPMDFAENADVINLVANSGAANSTLITSVHAARHLQNTLVQEGIAQSLDKLAFTDLLTGNTTIWSTGENVYLDPNGSKYSSTGDESYEGTWWLDDNGLLCETLGDGSTLCIADANEYLLTKSDSESFYTYSEVGFIGTFTISEGDSLGLSTLSTN